MANDASPLDALTVEDLMILIKRVYDDHPQIALNLAREVAVRAIRKAKEKAQ